MYYLETKCITRLQPTNNLQRSRHKYFYPLTNAQYAPFLSQGTSIPKPIAFGPFLTYPPRMFIAETVFPQGCKLEVAQTWSFLTQPHKKSHAGVPGRSGGHYSRSRSIFWMCPIHILGSVRIRNPWTASWKWGRASSWWKWGCWSLSAAVGKSPQKTPLKGSFPKTNWGRPHGPIWHKDIYT